MFDFNSFSFVRSIILCMTMPIFSFSWLLLIYFIGELLTGAETFIYDLDSVFAGVLIRHVQDSRIPFCEEEFSIFRY